MDSDDRGTAVKRSRDVAEADESAARKNAKHAPDESRERQRVALVLRKLETDPQFAAVLDFLNKGDIDVVAKSVRKHFSESIAISFERGDMRIKTRVTFAADDEREGTLDIKVLCDGVRTHFYPHLLACLHEDAWRDHAARMGLPEILRDVARFTEFFLALIAPLGSADSFEQYFPGLLLGTYTKDGEKYYFGYGGHMKAVFSIDFATDCDFYASESE